MKAQFFLLSIFLGVILAVHLAMNGQVGAIMKNPKVANAIFWCIGALTAMGIGVTGYSAGAFEPLQDVNKWLLLAGAMGASLVFAISWILQPGRMDAGSFFVTLLAGQIITGLVLSHFGLLGQAVVPLSMIKFIGVALMLGGAAMVTFMK
ncbi:MAG: DMT family transporter [Rhodothermales bacterium]